MDGVAVLGVGVAGIVSSLRFQVKLVNANLNDLLSKSDHLIIKVHKHLILLKTP